MSNKLAFSDEDKANSLATTFFNCHNISINSPSPYQLEVEQNTSNLNNKLSSIEKEDLLDDMDVCIVVDKLKIKKQHDNISNRVIKNLPNSAITILTKKKSTNILILGKLK